MAYLLTSIARKNVRRRIRHEWNVADVRLTFPLHAFDRFVTRHVNVGRVRIQTHLVARRHARETAVSHRRGNVYSADFLRFLERFLAPASGEHVISAAVRRQKVHRHHRKLQARAALKKKDVIVAQEPISSRRPDSARPMISSNVFER